MKTGHWRPRALERGTRAVSVVILIAICVACLLVLRQSLHFLGIAPFMHVDDSIANVAIALEEHGRYGFLSSPTQGFYNVDRTHAFFNYGPLYFYVATALTWLIGPSLLLYRMLHPVGLIAIVLAITWAFRRVSLVGPAIFTVVMFDMYLGSHWPIARPDIMVSLCVVGFLVSAAAAIDRGAPGHWLIAGFFAGSALTTHQIAAVVVPAAGVIWFWATFAMRQDGLPEANRRRAAVSLVALLTGGVLAALVYLVAIDFRMRDLLSLGSAGMTSNSRPFFETLGSHFYYAWSPLDARSFRDVLFGFCGAAALALSAGWLNATRRRQVCALVMPPVVIAVLYPLSLGFYGSNHTGYVILCQVTALWAVAAVASVTLSWISESSKLFGTVGLTALVAAAFFLMQANVVWATTPGLWEARAVGNVEIAEYVRQVVSRLPERASIWGALYFGLDAGDRTDLIQFGQVVPVVDEDFRAETRSDIAPDYLLLSSYEYNSAAVLSLARKGDEFGFERFVKTFPDVRYEPVRMVSAPPYGVTFVYRRRLGGPGAVTDAPPEVAVNDGTGRQWSSGLTPALDVTFRQTASVSVDASVSALRPRRQAEASVVADLPAGSFLVEVALDRPNAAGIGYLFATPGPHLYWRDGWTDFQLPVTPYWPGDTRVWMLVDHLGGPLYISRFENADDITVSGGAKGSPGYGIRVTSVRRISVLRDQTGRLVQLQVPAWTKWKGLDTKGADFESGEAGLARLSGTFSPDTVVLQSPPVSVPAHQRLALTVPTEVSSGAVKLAVLVPGGPFLAASTLLPRRVVFDTGDHHEVVIALINSELGLDERLDVRLRKPTLVPVIPQQQYVDQLMKCRSPYLALETDDCVSVR